jgi:hypothetical protein
MTLGSAVAAAVLESSNGLGCLPWKTKVGRRRKQSNRNSEYCTPLMNPFEKHIFVHPSLPFISHFLCLLNPVLLI